MVRLVVVGCAALAGVLSLGSSRLVAQFPPAPGGAGTARPTFSPYLNLNRSGNSPGVNLYGIVRPQFAARAEFQSLEQQAAANRQGIADLGTPPTALPTTGHPIAFLNTGGYFMNLNPGQGQGGGLGGGQSGFSFGGQGLMQGGGGARPGGAGGTRGASPRR